MPLPDLFAPSRPAPVEAVAPPWVAPGLTRAERVLAFCETLPITSGKHAGEPFRFRPWQRRWIERVYRTDPAGHRLVRTAVMSLARKNGKTDLAARLCLCHLCGPEAEPRGECYSAANDRFQAGKIFAEQVAIIEAVAWMKARVSIRRHSKELEDIGLGGTGSTYAALSADVATKHGLSPSFWCYDEMGQAPNADLLHVLDTAMGARAEPLGLVISTQAARDDAPLSELIDYGLRVQSGELDDPSFDLEFYTAPADADPWAPETWALANPALGDFRSLEDVKRLAAQAQRLPSKEASFRNLVLNQRIDISQAFMSAAVWKACAGPVDLAALAGRRCFGGLDLAASRDLTALVLAFEADDGGLDLVPLFWLPDADLREREEQDRAPYTRWRDDGFLRTVPGKTIDPRAVALAIAELHGRYEIGAIHYDRWRIEALRRELEGVGCDVKLEPHGQGFRDMSPSIDALERFAVEGKLRHGGHPLLTWCAANAKTLADSAGNRKLDKAKSTGRIDGLVAAAMAIGAYARAAAEPVYDFSRPLVLSA